MNHHLAKKNVSILGVRQIFHAQSCWYFFLGLIFKSEIDVFFGFCPGMGRFSQFFQCFFYRSFSHLLNGMILQEEELYIGMTRYNYRIPQVENSNDPCSWMGLSLELDMIYTCFAFLKGYEPLAWDAGIWHDLTSDDPTWNGNPPKALEIWNGRGRESGEKLKLLQSRTWTIQPYSTSDKRRGDCCFLSH